MSENLKNGLLITSLVLNFVSVVWLIGVTILVSHNKDAVERRDREILEAFQVQNAKIEEALTNSYKAFLKIN